MVVSGFARPDFVVEIEALAAVSSSAAASERRDGHLLDRFRICGVEDGRLGGHLGLWLVRRRQLIGLVVSRERRIGHLLDRWSVCDVARIARSTGERRSPPEAGSRRQGGLPRHRQGYLQLRFLSAKNVSLNVMTEFADFYLHDTACLSSKATVGATLAATSTISAVDVALVFGLTSATRGRVMTDRQPQAGRGSVRAPYPHNAHPVTPARSSFFGAMDL